ncbi:MAG: ANTAR domain-containing protein, partial [bacterium]|nr:ANTAR domain-containing protein [bacterium]
PIDINLYIQTLRIICLTRDKINEMKTNTLSIKNKLDEIKLVGEAKILIVKNLNVSENEAHKLIEQNAMNLRITKKQSAEMFIKKYS